MGHLKNLEISKYKRESNGRWPIKICHLFLLIVVLFGFINIKCKNICHTISFFNKTIVVQVRYIIIEAKEFPRIGYNGFLFPLSYRQVTALVLRTSAFTWVLMRKRKPVISNTGRFFCFNTTVSYTYLSFFFKYDCC